MAVAKTNSSPIMRIWPFLIMLPVVLCAYFGYGQAPPDMSPTGPLLDQLAKEAPKEMVVDVQVKGNHAVTMDKIVPHIRTRAGRAFDATSVEDDVRRLVACKLFVSVRPSYQEVAGGRVVIFEVVERPTVNKLLFLGNESISKKVLLKECGLKEGDAVDPYAVEESRKKIEDFYQKRGFGQTRVTMLEGDKVGDTRAIFLINEGKKQKVLRVVFEGNTIASGSRLQTQIKSNPPFLYLFKGEVDRKEIDEDVKRLTAYYRGLGFLRAKIGREMEFNEKQNWLTLRFVIDEGPRYSVRDISIINNTKIPTEKLTADMKLKSGQFFNQAEMAADVAGIRDKYGSIGYVFADVKDDRRMLEDDAKLDLVYNINEGDRYRVGRINVEIKGENPHTRLATVLNRMSLKPGDIVDIRKLRDSEKLLKASQLFMNNPMEGEVPKIVFHPPTGDDPDTQMAEKPKRRANIRGQSPDADDATNTEPSAGPSYNTGLSPSGSRERTLDFEVRGTLNPNPPPYLIPTQYTTETAPMQTTGPAWPPPPSAQPMPGPALGGGANYQNGGAQSGARSAADLIPPPPGQIGAPMPGPALQTLPAQAPATSPSGQVFQTPAGPPQWPAAPQAQPLTVLPDPTPNDPVFTNPLPIEIWTKEAPTGRFMLGVGVNSDAGLYGSVVWDEMNFDITRFPRSWEEIRNATAFRGAGQRFRIEAAPGTQVQRYMATFIEPYLFNTDVSLSLSGFYYDRIYTEWAEQRLGGRASLGYHFTPHLTGSMSFRGEKVNIRNPIDPNLPDLKEVLGDNAIYGFGAQLSHDTRDSPFLATEGHLIELNFEQVIGTFQYPHAELDMRKYFLLHQRPDTSGRHVLSLTSRVGVSGDNTPIYDRYYAGGFTTLRGFSFRGVSPVASDGVRVGGKFEALASAEYMFPITADDMLRGVVFCDTGTIQPSINHMTDNYRVAPGFGLRIVIPMMGPAPIAFDFAFPVSFSPSDSREVFSFYLGMLR
jgi:outer membrane protein insertion porin family